MAEYENKRLPRALDQQIAPAVWDADEQEWKVLTGKDGSMSVSGSVSVENLPDKVNVQDETVAEKLESLKQVVEQQQDSDDGTGRKLNEIEERLSRIVELMELSGSDNGTGEEG
ncbi:hypothetical protein [Oceanobacillus oncorhynchi]|uniref:hypothetical protein n=1 Tax=Oceanobacillus oncorhynchi TaxID=545501 RepID=UPI001868079B|nr:hypothetical protein [Oceanobacillus oncorhynchi]